MSKIKEFIKKNKIFSLLIVVAIAIISVGIFAPIIAPYSPFEGIYMMHFYRLVVSIYLEQINLVEMYFLVLFMVQEYLLQHHWYLLFQFLQLVQL